MPVRRYRSIDDMEDTFWVPPGTPQHHEAVRLVLESAAFIAPQRRVPGGVFKFKSFEDALAQQDAWEGGCRVR